MRALLLCLVLASNVPPFSIEERWQEAFVVRMHILEEKHGITFDSGWTPQVKVGVPDDMHPMLQMQFGALYDSQARSFMISPLQKDMVDVCLIDHELGHALADQISRRIGNGTWPDSEGWDMLSLYDRFGVNIISEGIGSYFAGPNSNAGEGWLPEAPGDRTWAVRDFIYHGGHWLVAPIISTYGERGIAYLVTHRLIFPDGKVRAAAREYQQKALEELSRSQTTTGSQRCGPVF